MAVDTAESAEQALDCTPPAGRDLHGSPDAWHGRLPGRAGHQGGSPDGDDPVYTSQEGEHASQARALGAVGVLPKTVRPVDVSRVLYQLHLLADRRQPRLGVVRRVAADRCGWRRSSPRRGPGDPESSCHCCSGSGRELYRHQLDGQLGGASCRAAGQPARVAAAGHARALHRAAPLHAGDVRGVRPPHPRPQSPEATEKAAAAAAVMEPAPHRRRRGRRGGRLRSRRCSRRCATMLGYLFWQAAARDEALARELVESRSALSDAETEAAAAARRAESAALAAAAAVVASPGAAPSRRCPCRRAGCRTGRGPRRRTARGRVRALRRDSAVGRAPAEGTRCDARVAAHLRGRVVVETRAGDFCLSGTAGREGFEPTAAARPSVECNVIGNPFDDSLTAARRPSVDFANFVGDPAPAPSRRCRGAADRPTPTGAARSRIRSRARPRGRRLDRRGGAGRPRRVPGGAGGMTRIRPERPGGPVSDTAPGAGADDFGRRRGSVTGTCSPSSRACRCARHRRCRALLDASTPEVLDCGEGVRLLAHRATLQQRLAPAARLVMLLHGLEGSADSTCWRSVSCCSSAATRCCGSTCASRRQPSAGALPLLPHRRGRRAAAAGARAGTGTRSHHCPSRGCTAAVCTSTHRRRLPGARPRAHARQLAGRCTVATSSGNGAAACAGSRRRGPTTTT